MILHAPFYHHIGDSIEEIHAIIIGLVLGAFVLFLARYGHKTLAGFIPGLMVGAFAVLFIDGVLVYWPAYKHAWYLMGAAAASLVTLHLLLTSLRDER